MQSLETIRGVRIAKIEKLRQLGVEPYPYAFDRTHLAGDVIDNFGKLESSGEVVSVSGRLMSIRGHGKTGFAHLQDLQGKLQIYVRKDLVSELVFAIFEQLDIGDHVGAKGKVFRTKTGEITVAVEELTILAKAIHPLPAVKEKETEEGREIFDQFQDREQRYRRRYVDLVVNPQVRDTFIIRSRIISEMRSYLENKGYLEVETPILQPIYGGAFARPFTTHFNALDMDLYLRISDELYLKRLIVGGFEKVFEIGKNFRNEGMDRFHNPEFTMMELYSAYEDYNAMMRLVEEMVAHIAMKIVGSASITFQGNAIMLDSPWQRLSYFDGIRQFTGKDVAGMDESALRNLAKDLEVEPENFWGKGKLLEEIFDKTVEPKLIQPTFVLDYPLEISPLAKRHREHPDLVERFEGIVAGKEICNAFSELNDPQDQLRRFQAQAEMREKGDLEAQVLDEDFILALEYGMPPTGGLGVGIDRLVMLLTNCESIRDALLFPHMRPAPKAEFVSKKENES